jgi:hypothetical protein
METYRSTICQKSLKMTAWIVRFFVSSVALRHRNADPAPFRHPVDGFLTFLSYCLAAFAWIFFSDFRTWPSASSPETPFGRPSEAASPPAKSLGSFLSSRLVNSFREVGHFAFFYFFCPHPDSRQPNVCRNQ